MDASAVSDTGYRFDRASHTYWHGDRRIPGVTECLTRLGVIDGTAFVDEDALERGTATHAYLLQFVRSLLEDRDPVPPPVQYRGYCQAGERALEEYRLTPTLAELIMFSGQLDAGGTLDLVATCGLPGYPAGEGIIDWKTGREYDWHVFQLVLYAMMYAEVTGLAPTWAANFYLDADGSFRPKFRSITPHLQYQSLAFLSTAKWLIAHR